MDGEECLTYSPDNGFKVLLWDEYEGQFYDNIADTYIDNVVLWAYLPARQCEELIKRTTTKIQNSEYLKLDPATVVSHS